MSIQLSNGMSMPAIGYGTWKLDKEIAADTIYLAIKLGYRHIDCAYFYGNEVEVGHGITRALKDGIVKREDLWITSKVWNDDHANVEAACNISLERLNLTYLDLYLVHWPVHWKKGTALERPEIDPNITHLSTWRQMEALVDAGKVRSIGVSNYNADEIREFFADARIKPVVNQVESHIAFHQLALQKAIEKEFNMKLVAYRCINVGNGIYLEHPVIVDMAKKYNKTAVQIMLRYQLELDRSVIFKSATESRLIENLQATEFTLEKSDVELLTNAFEQKRYSNFLYWRGDDGYVFRD